MRARKRGPVPHVSWSVPLSRRAQDTITGFLLAGVGNVDLRRKSNFLIVDQSASAQAALAHSALLVWRALLAPQRADAQPPAGRPQRRPRAQLRTRSRTSPPGTTSRWC